LTFQHHLPAFGTASRAAGKRRVRKTRTHGASGCRARVLFLGLPNLTPRFTPGFTGSTSIKPNEINGVHGFTSKLGGCAIHPPTLPSVALAKEGRLAVTLPPKSPTHTEPNRTKSRQIKPNQTIKACSEARLGGRASISAFCFVFQTKPEQTEGEGVTSNHLTFVQR
jgi:hypothetical protein